MSLEPGQFLDAKYRVLRLIGEGGMGTVYEGENSRIGRRVAIKVLHSRVASMPGFAERFEREARAAVRVGSPHICDVIDFGDLPNGDRYIVMEYLEGTSLEERLIRVVRLTVDQLAPIAIEILEGLATMHAARVVHRDLKPANIFLARTTSGRGEIVKILDFGVAKLLPFEGEVGTMTQTGVMMGTPLYMSPEQARGARDVDARTDIYAASVIFYRALTGTLPYNADTLNELLFKIVLEDARPLRELAPEIDPDFAALIHKGLARELTQRFESAREYQREILAWGQAQGRKSPPFGGGTASEPRLSASGSRQASEANAATGPSFGTPTAWSENLPKAGSWSTKTVSLESGAHEHRSRPMEAGVPPMTPVGSGSAPDFHQSPPQGMRPMMGPSTPEPAPAPWGGPVGGHSPGMATPSGSGPYPPPQYAAQATTTASSRSRPLAIALGALGVVGALAVVATLLFSRASNQPEGEGPSSSASAASSASANPVLATPEPKEPVAPPAITEPAEVATTADASTTTAIATAARPRHDFVPRGPVPARPSDAKPVASSAEPPSAPHTPTPVASPAASPPASGKSPGTPRKFRTKLDE